MMRSKYKRIRLSRDETMDEHRLIATCKLSRWLDSDEVVHHKDGDPLNNSWENLEVMSKSDHARLHRPKGTPHNIMSEVARERLREMNKGENCPTAKLTEKEVIIIRERLKRKVTIRELAEEFGVAHRTILRIKQGETWKHLLPRSKSKGKKLLQ